MRTVEQARVECQPAGDESYDQATACEQASRRTSWKATTSTTLTGAL
jgi:hypothetical protein